MVLGEQYTARQHHRVRHPANDEETFKRCPFCDGMPEGVVAEGTLEISDNTQNEGEAVRTVYSQLCDQYYYLIFKL